MRIAAVKVIVKQCDKLLAHTESRKSFKIQRNEREKSYLVILELILFSLFDRKKMVVEFYLAVPVVLVSVVSEVSAE